MVLLKTSSHNKALLWNCHEIWVKSGLLSMANMTPTVCMAFTNTSSCITCHFCPVPGSTELVVVS